MFEARKKYFITGEYKSPSRDMFNKKISGCLSTRFVLVCQKDSTNLKPTFNPPEVDIAPSLNDQIIEMNRHTLVYRNCLSANWYQAVDWTAGLTFRWTNERSPKMDADEMEGQSKLTEKMMKILKPNRPYVNHNDIKLWHSKIRHFNNAF